jgi:tetratricopeptide (TPR) repeat protein
LTTAWLLQGELNELAGREADAHKAFLSAFSSNPRSAVAAYHLLRTSPPESSARADARRALLASHDDVMAASVASTRPVWIAAPLFDDRADAPTVFLPAWYEPAIALLQARRYDAAMSAIQSCWQTDPRRADPAMAGTVLTDVSRLLAKGQTAAAMAMLPTHGQLALRSSEVHRLRALGYWADSKTGEAVTEMEMAVKIGTWNERAHIGLATMLANAGGLDQAERLLASARAHFPDSSAISWVQAGVYAVLGRDQEYLQALDDSVRVGPLTGAVTIWSALGRLELRGFDVEAAERAFRRNLALAPNVAQGHLDLGDLLRAQGRADEALAEYLAVLLIDPNRLAAHVSIGQMHLDEGRPADAVRVLRYAVARKADLPEARYALVSALLRLGRTSEGQRELEAFRPLQAREMANDRRSYQVATLRLDARLREASGRDREALTLWQQVVAAEPDVPLNYISLADSLIRLHEFAEAAKQLERAAALGAPPDVYRQLAAVYERIGLSDKSAAALRKYDAGHQASRQRQGASR